uniref:SFRICE_040993 n=1 Tax=Spodoptera frugiperda TaxID=7108 RepID=A0A2H1X1E3_SPOFR
MAKQRLPGQLTVILIIIFMLIRFEALKKMIRQEHVLELQRKYEAEQKQELKDLTSGRGKPPAGSRQISQFSRYSDVILPPARRAIYHPYLEYAAPEFVPYY